MTQKKRVHFADDSVATLETTMPIPMSKEDTGNAADNPAKTGANSLSVAPDASDVDPAAIQSERRWRIAIAQDEELKWLNLKTVLRGNSDKLKDRAARDAWKIAERFLLTDDDNEIWLDLPRIPDPTWIDEADLNCGALLYEFLRDRANRNRFGVMQSHEEP
ncbi:hypothetical protein PHMEG_00035528 [Phytophthora megakarya]|uniref:Uncharacterized protein n=1 Tax=Phytophthora megakarya TaxID=4795 RepID=A0A225UNH8_9STRA|nr:hypothetical protein PHMEG_00035528 [Phytophthora megakarya]